MPQPTQRLIPFALSVALGVAIAHDVTPAAALTLPAGTLAAEEAAVANAIAASARLGFDASLRVVARADADLVVTEHGVADLRFASLEERAARMAAIAAPAFRDGLLAAWRAQA